MDVKPLHDVLLVELEPEKKVTAGGIIRPDTAPNPVRIGRVLRVGPGKRWKGKGSNKAVMHEMAVKVGERVIFFAANLETKQGKQLCYLLSENQGLLRETDVVAVLDDESDVVVGV